MTATRARGPLFLILGLALGGWLIYLGVSATSSNPETSALPAHQELAFLPWNQATWSEAAARPALVFLLISDSLAQRARDLETWLSQQPLAATVAGQFLPVRIDRRDRPDLVERYAENQVPHLSVLLPTGEALARLSGEPDTWSEQLVETVRYWRDHQSELRDRAEAFWQSQAEPALPIEAAPSPESDLRALDSAVSLLVSDLIEQNPGPALWRTDLDRYLSARRSPRADSLHAALKAARTARVNELGSAATLEATRAEWLRTILELHRYGGLDVQAERLRNAKTEWDRLGRAATAEEAALEVQLAAALGDASTPTYPGSWLGIVSTAGASLPHTPEQMDLDGYLMDALTWLECLLDLEGAASNQIATRLADSLWAGLWDSERKALRDKPAFDGYLREVTVFPRVQLGRAASCFDRLSRVTGEGRFAARADSCISGFAPYASAAGAAATLYGESLSRRAGGS